MTRIDFYQIDNDEAPLVFACRLIDKVYRLGHQIYVHTRDKTEAEALDDLLWTFREERFVPHACKDAGEPAPVLIGHGETPADHHEILVNLSGEIPEFFSRYDRVAEVVPLDEASRTAARANYKFYKDRGYPLQYHPVK